MDLKRSRIPDNVTAVVDLREYFLNYSSFVSSLSSKNKKKPLGYLIETLGLSGDEFEELNNKFVLNKQSWKYVEIAKFKVPINGFLPDFKLFEIPKETKLKSLQHLKTFITQNKARNTLVRYRGQISCDNTTDPEEDEGKVLIKEYSDYLLNVRVYIPATYWAFTSNKRTNQLNVSQEFLVYGSQCLSSLRDRILCPEDYRSAEGDVSLNPFTPTKVTNRNVYRSSMFFINDAFFIDGRYSGNIDYSYEIKSWAKGKKLTYDSTENMESVSFNSLKFRLGFPYLFMHQGNCEHLVIFTDARLIQPSDVLVKAAYPIMKSYCSLRGRRCTMCWKKIPKFIVTEMPTLPRMRSYLCGLCLFRYCYTEDGKKLGNFSVYKYVDRVAIF